ncbi:7112_t:CDS:10 [Dentiscutata erythropus]|uniref:7112_t:CDS:1 n=1 Tax=Dentiscutata erythropus TaxID=1348616 RepID=A0A9N8ZP82_9GLOM|nr:7112_t:CDS:10 [Dentiscutata erythropus]
MSTTTSNDDNNNEKNFVIKEGNDSYNCCDNNSYVNSEKNIDDDDELPRVQMSKIKLDILFSGPAIFNQFGSIEKTAWVAIADLFTATAFQPTYGNFADIFGRKVTVLSSLLIFGIGSALSGASSSINMLIASRAITGIGAGGFIGLTSIIIADIVSLKNRGKYMGFAGGVYAIGSILGPLLGGLFSDRLSWRWIFYINLPLGALITIFIILLLNIPSPPGSLKDKLKRVDWLGTLLMAISAISLLLPLQYGGIEHSWNSPLIIILFILGGLGFIAFVYVETFISIEPIAPVKLFKDRTIVACFALNFFYSIGLYENIFYVPLFFQIVDATKSGTKLLAYVLGAVVSAVITGQILSRASGYSYKIICVMGGALMTIGGGLTFGFNENTNSREQIGYLLISGLGAGSVFQTGLLAAQAMVKLEDIATVTSLITFFRSLGSVIGLSIFSSIFNNFLIKNTLETFPGFKIDQFKGDLNTFKALPNTIKSPILGIFVKSFQNVFLVGLIAGGLLLFSSLFMKNYIRNGREKISK